MQIDEARALGGTVVVETFVVTVIVREAELGEALHREDARRGLLELGGTMRSEMLTPGMSAAAYACDGSARKRPTQPLPPSVASGSPVCHAIFETSWERLYSG